MRWMLLQEREGTVYEYGWRTLTVYEIGFGGNERMTLQLRWETGACELAWFSMSQVLPRSLNPNIAVSK
jgi:hypothetical protein